MDLLTYFGIKSNFIIDHLVGKLCCTYAVGCLQKKIVPSALCDDKTLVKWNWPSGSMAAVCFEYEDIKALCPPGIDVACYNSSWSSTISGPAKTMTKFVVDLIHVHKQKEPLPKEFRAVK